MLMLLIFLGVALVTYAISLRDDEDSIKHFLRTAIIIFIICNAIVFKRHDYKPSTPMQINIEKEYIYSLNNGSDKIFGSFILGSGTIGSTTQYSYFIQNSDGSKQKKSIQADGTKIYEGLDNPSNPYIEIVTCKDGEYYSFLTGLFEDSEEEKCQKRIERKIFVPNNTIILEYNVK